MTDNVDIRFAHNTDSEHLGRMLDEYFFRTQNPADALLKAALWPQLARKNDPQIRFGSMITANANGTVSIASASAASTSATGVVVSVLEGDRVYWSTDAIITIPVLGTKGSGLQELWLTASGLVTLDKPTTGIIQRVGFSLFYDSAKDNHLCRIMLGPVMGIDLGS